MRNFISRIPLGDDKWAFEQAPYFADEAAHQMKKIQKLWNAPEYFFHLKSGGHVAAVQRHLKSHHFAKIDLKRFFEQVSRNRIIRRLCAIGIAHKAASEFAIESTVWRNARTSNGTKKFVLPYGFVQSALLASLDLDKSMLGRNIRDLVSKGLVVSVYVDDIVISSESKELVELSLPKIVSAAQMAGFPINQEKSTNVQPQMSAFNIDFGHNRMCVSPERMLKFEEDIMMASDDGRKIAIVAYVRSINPNQALSFYRAFHGRLACAAHLFV